MKLLPIFNGNKKPSIITVVLGMLQSLLRNPHTRRNAAFIFTSYKRKSVPGQDKRLFKLLESGFVNYPGFLTKSQVDEIVAAIKTFPCFDPWKKSLGFFNYDHPPKETHVAHVHDVARIAVLHDLATCDEVVDLVTRYFKCRPVLDSIQAWWSYPGHETPEEAEYFHRDNESLRFLKFFIYLTDVDQVCGPHVLVDGSANTNTLVGSGRYADQEVLKAYGKDKIIAMHGSAGDAFLEDTYGLHKGLLPLENRRLLLQFRYSIHKTIFHAKSTVSGLVYNKQKIYSVVAD